MIRASSGSRITASAPEAAALSKPSGRLAGTNNAAITSCSSGSDAIMKAIP
jgi:hypothetical protein